MSRPQPVTPPSAASADTLSADHKLSDALPRLTYRLDELATALGVSRRTIERERSAGRFPRPDLKIGKAPLWTLETIRAWIEGGGRS